MMRQPATKRLPAISLLAGLAGCSPSPESVVEGPAGTGSTSAEGDGTDATVAEPSTSAEGPSDGGSTSSGPAPTTGSVDESSSGEPAATTGGLDCATIVYVHFDGITLTEGPDDATMDTTAVGDLAIELAPYDGDDKAEIVAFAASRFADFDVCFTDERPTEGDYAMGVVTPTNPFGDGVFGIATTDCGNANPSNIVFAFSESVDAELMGMSIARSVAISFGLDAHNDGDADLMSIVSAADSMLLDECLSFGTVAPQCDHDPCRGGDQNAYQELLARLGPAT